MLMIWNAFPLEGRAQGCIGIINEKIVNTFVFFFNNIYITPGIPQEPGFINVYNSDKEPLFARVLLSTHSLSHTKIVQ